MTEPPVLIERDAAVVTIRLNSVANRNALSETLVRGLIDALVDAGEDQEVKAVVLTHEGPAFCAGRTLSRHAITAWVREPSGSSGCWQRSFTCPSRVIVQLDGATRAGGLGVVAACDIAIAGPQASFAFTEARLALAPAVIALTVLPRISSRGASRYMLTCETFGAQAAADIGLVTAATENPDEHVATICDAITRCPRHGLEQTKALVSAELASRVDEGGDAAAALSAELFGSAEARELIAALLRR